PVRDVEHRGSVMACGGKQLRGAGDCRRSGRDGDRAGQILVLKVDEHQSGIADLRWMKIGAGKLQEGLGGDHGPSFRCRIVSGAYSAVTLESPGAVREAAWPWASRSTASRTSSSRSGMRPASRSGRSCATSST